MAVQRFPDQYDGLVLGAPAIHWDRFIPAELWPQVVMNAAVGGPITPAKLNAATSAAIAACDKDDGVSDGIINDPRRCTYDPATLVCKEGDAAATCLTKPEADAIRKIWDGPKTASGDRLWFGLERGAPLGALAGGSPFPIASTHVQYWTHQDPKFDWRTITEAQFEQEFRTSAQKFHDLIGTDQAKLERFRAHASKMIIWHGEADQLIFPRGTINYFNRVVEANGGAAETAKFARLYMAPGVGHCGGGVGPMPTGLLESVVNWVEKRVAPTTFMPRARRVVRGVAYRVPALRARDRSALTQRPHNGMARAVRTTPRTSPVSAVIHGPLTTRSGRAKDGLPTVATRSERGGRNVAKHRGACLVLVADESAAWLRRRPFAPIHCCMDPKETQGCVPCLLIFDMRSG